MTKRKNAQATAPENGSVLFIPLNKLKNSPRNARKTPHPKADIEALAASIAASGMLQNPVVEPEHDAEGAFTGNFLVTIGEGRRQAQLLRAKRKEITKAEPIRCLVETEANAFEISLAENAIRSPMHPADQFEAFFELHTQHGMSAEDIGARFGVTPAVVKQRLKLAVVSPVLMRIYREGGMALDQLAAFTLTDDHARQEQIWSRLPYDNSRRQIILMLNEENIEATDRRVIFVGLEAYQAAGGVITRDLFDDEHEGFLTDPELLNQLVEAKLEQIAETVRTEGWKWVEVLPRYDHTAVADMRRVYPDEPALSEDVEAKIETLEAVLQALEFGDESEEANAEAESLEKQIAALRGDDVFDREDVSRAGVIISVGYDGEARIERGFIRPEDDTRRSASAKPKPSKDGPAPLPEKLVAELTAHRTMALRNALGNDHAMALRATVHALACATFFPHSPVKSCLQVKSESTYLARYAPEIEDTAAAMQIAQRHEPWISRLPDDADDMWAFILTLEQAELLALLAACVSVTVDAVEGSRLGNEGKDHADQLALALQLDMRLAWKPTAEGYFVRVSKDRILEAVREGVSPEAASNLASMKKQQMAEAAEQRLADRGWLPEVLRRPAPETVPEQVRNAA